MLFRSFFEARLHLTELNEVLIIIRDMSERISLENKLRYMAERDYQTGLRNRMKFELSIRQYEKRSDISVGLILFDIDGLKGINDTLGHYEGDKVIKVVSENIEKIFAQAAIKLGEHLKLKTHTIDQITLLTKFHDIGKVGIPDDI